MSAGISRPVFSPGKRGSRPTRTPRSRRRRGRRWSGCPLGLSQTQVLRSPLLQFRAGRARPAIQAAPVPRSAIEIFSGRSASPPVYRVIIVTPRIGSASMREHDRILRLLESVTWLAFRNLQPIARELGVEVRWKPVLVGGIFNAVNPSVYEFRERGVPAKQAYLRTTSPTGRGAGIRIRFPPTVFPGEQREGDARLPAARTRRRPLVPFAEAVFHAYWERRPRHIPGRGARGNLRRRRRRAERFFAGIARPTSGPAAGEHRGSDRPRRFGSPTMFVGGDDIISAMTGWPGPRGRCCAAAAPETRHARRPPTGGSDMMNLLRRFPHRCVGSRSRRRGAGRPRVRSPRWPRRGNGSRPRRHDPGGVDAIWRAVERSTRPGCIPAFDGAAAPRPDRAESAIGHAAATVPATSANARWR